MKKFTGNLCFYNIIKDIKKLEEADEKQQNFAKICGDLRASLIEIPDS